MDHNNRFSSFSFFPLRSDGLAHIADDDLETNGAMFGGAAAKSLKDMQLISKVTPLKHLPFSAPMLYMGYILPTACNGSAAAASLSPPPCETPPYKGVCKTL